MDTSSQPKDIVNRTFLFALEIVQLCKSLNEEPGVPRILVHQLLRSGTSVGANLEEAQAAQSSADFVAKCAISLKEARETVYWLRLLKGATYLETLGTEKIMDEAVQIGKILGSITSHAKRKLKTQKLNEN